MEVAVVGDSELAMGFKLIGIKQIYESESKDDLKSNFKKAMEGDVGVIITNDKAIDKLDQRFRRKVESSISPIIVVLSKESGASENLREMIKKAIGIDLWNK
jgi:V/A-type H+-transporting ATPase subunit F